MKKLNFLRKFITLEKAACRKEKRVHLQKEDLTLEKILVQIDSDGKEVTVLEVEAKNDLELMHFRTQLIARMRSFSALL